MASYTEFMGYTQPWYPVRDVDEPIGGEMGYVSCFLCDGDRMFLTYSTTGRGSEAARGSLALPGMTPYGRGAAWQTSPDGWPRGTTRAGTGARTRPGTPPGCGQPPRCRSGPAPARPQPRPPAGTVTTTEATSAGPTGP